MENNGYFKDSSAEVGGKRVPFAQRTVQNKFRIWIPESFTEDSSLDYRYAYLSNAGKSPLGIALRFAPVSNEELKQRMTSSYFGRTEDCSELKGALGNRIVYRCTENAGSYMSIFSIRFAVDLPKGVMLGCFTCSSDFEKDWKQPVFEMLRAIEPVGE